MYILRRIHVECLALLPLGAFATNFIPWEWKVHPTPIPRAVYTIQIILSSTRAASLVRFLGRVLAVFDDLRQLVKLVLGASNE